jgi:SAM-dependent MidA family methyltransferase
MASDLSLPESQAAALAAMIRREIEAASGVISFARFMELALYAPGLGYYEREEVTIGRRGDFYTSSSVGSLFGELLAFQFAEWAQAKTPPLQVIEAGAHDGQLAADILAWTQRQRPHLYAVLEYWIAEPSAPRRVCQEKKLAEFAPRVRWSKRVKGIPSSPFRVMFCNELLDAMPVRRFGWDAPARRWFEWGVAWDGAGFVWARMSEVDALSIGGHPLASAPSAALPDGSILETSPAAGDWWREAAAALGQGKLLAFDYGWTEEELLASPRLEGTLRAYRRHQHSGCLLADPGWQDLTAHVDFTALQRLGEAADLKTEGFVSQSQFLTGIAARTWSDPESFGDWSPARRREFLTLTHPEHLGRAFRVLVQSADGRAAAATVLPAAARIPPSS